MASELHELKGQWSILKDPVVFEEEPGVLINQDGTLSRPLWKASVTLL